MKHSQSLLFISFKSFFALIFSALFFYAYYERFAKWDFNELGRYYDSETQSVYTTGGIVWIFPAVIFLIIGLLNLVKAVKHFGQIKADKK